MPLHIRIPIVTVDDLDDAVQKILERINLMAEATQADIDNLVAQVKQVATDLEGDFAQLQATIDDLSNQGVDVTALQEAIAPLDDRVKTLGQLQPTPPSPPPAV